MHSSSDAAGLPPHPNVPPWYLRKLLLLGTGIVAPLLLALYYVRRFGVNVPEADQWFFVPTLEAFYSGEPWFPLIVAHYSEHRLIFPRLLMLGMARLTHYNVKWEMYVSVLLMALCAVLIWRLIQITSVPKWMILPAGFLLLSPAQYENMLVGWQIQIPMANAFLLGMVVLLGSRSLNWVRWMGAATCAVVATFSFSTGPAAWLVGIFLLTDKWREHRRHSFAWIVLAMVVAAFYRWNYPGARDVPPDYLSFWLRPVATTKLFLAVLGNNFGGGEIVPSIVAGAVLVILVVLSVVSLRRASRQDLRPWYALMLFSVIAVGFIALGRNFAWEAFAGATRYMTISVFVPISLLTIGAVMLRNSAAAERRKYAWMYSATLVLGTVFAVITTRPAWAAGEAVLQDRLIARACLLDYRNASTDCLKRMFAYGGEIVRKEAVTLEKYKLGPFHSRPSRPPGFK